MGVVGVFFYFDLLNNLPVRYGCTDNMSDMIAPLAQKPTSELSTIQLREELRMLGQNSIGSRGDLLQRLDEYMLKRAKEDAELESELASDDSQSSEDSDRSRKSSKKSKRRKRKRKKEKSSKKSSKKKKRKSE